MLTAVSRSVWLIYQLPASQRGKYGRTLVGGVGWFALGFVIWNLDNYFCVYLRDTRRFLTDRGVGFLGHFTEGEWSARVSESSGATFNRERKRERVRERERA